MGIPRSMLVVTVAGLMLGPTVSPAFATGDRARAGRTVRASVSTAGRQANMQSTSEVISANGRYVAFISFATNLVPGDTNGFRDVFVRDLFTRTTSRVNVSDTGAQADDDTTDGRYVAFNSHATNLVPGDTNAAPDVFVHDRFTGTTTRESVSGTGEQANGPSAAGLASGLAISGDGRFVAFESSASNLVPADTNAADDIFVRDRLAGTTTRVSVSSAGEQANAA